MHKILANLILFVVLSLPAASLADEIDGIAVIVNDEPITKYEVAKEQGDMEKALAGNSAKKTAGDGQLREAALNSLINKKLITQKIKELDIKISDDEIKQAIEDVKKQNNISQETLVAALNSQGISYEQYKAQLREQLERLRLISQEVRSKIQITEKEVREYYSANPEKYGEDESFRARLITLKIPANSSPEQRKRLNDKAYAIFT
ncbi:peptidylprolyl isomerase, partial [bacterium]